MKQLESRLRKFMEESEWSEFEQALIHVQENRKKFKTLRLRKGIDPEWVRSELKVELGEQIPWCKEGYSYSVQQLGDPELHPLLACGLAFIQEASAMEAVTLLHPQAHEVVLDLCAAPGAKSTQLYDFIREGSGYLVSNEAVRERSKLLNQLLIRWGALRSSVYNLMPHELALKHAGCFDAVLVDAPCSGESLFAKRSDDRSDVSDGEVKRCSKRQKKILDSAVVLLRGGGRILYSTCTYSKEENEEVVQDFLKRYPYFQLVKEQRRWPHQDQVVGGYCALLQDTREDELRKDLKVEFGHGLVRQGAQRWNKEQELELLFRAGEYQPAKEQYLSREEAIEKLNDYNKKSLFKSIGEKEVGIYYDCHPLLLLRKSLF